MGEEPVDGRLAEDRLRGDDPVVLDPVVLDPVVLDPVVLDAVVLDAVESDAAVLLEVAPREDVAPLEEEVGRRVVMLPARCEVVRVVRFEAGGLGCVLSWSLDVVPPNTLRPSAPIRSAKGVDGFGLDAVR